MKKKFRPEFLNRIDAAIVFHALTKEHIREIVDLMLREAVNSMDGETDNPGSYRRCQGLPGRERVRSRTMAHVRCAA